MPLFALGVTQALVSYYEVWDVTKVEVRKIALLFCGGAVISIFNHGLLHTFFGIMGERLTLRVRQKMFSGKNFGFFEIYTIFLHRFQIIIIIKPSIYIDFK